MLYKICYLLLSEIIFFAALFSTLVFHLTSQDACIFPHMKSVPHFIVLLSFFYPGKIGWKKAPLS